MNYKILLLFVSSIIFSCSKSSDIEDLDGKNPFLKKTSSYWNENDFYQIKFVKIGESKAKFSNESFSLTEGLLIEEISENEYKKANEQKIRYYLKDTLALVKFQNKIKVGNTILEDFNKKEKNYQFYSYLGYFPILNQYLIKGEYLDSVDYKMIDKHTGQIKNSFIDYPIISKNGDFTVVCKTNEIDKQTYLEFFKYENGFYSNLIKVSFSNWRILDNENLTFWGSNGSLYLKVNNLINNSNLSQTYLKITLN